MMRILVRIFIILTTVALIFPFSGCHGTDATYSETTVVTDEPAANRPAQDQTQAPRLQTVKAAPRRSDAGHLTVDRKMIDFGLVEPLADFNGKFTLTNDGNEDLIIASLTESCQCTVGKIKVPTTLKPGESIPLEVKFKTPAAAGPVLHNVTVHSKPPAQPEKLTVSVTALVKKLVQTQPELLELEMRRDAPGEYQVVVESTDQQSFTIGGYTVSGGALQLTYDKKVKSTKHTLTVSKMDFERLRLTPIGYLNLKVNHPKISDVILRFRAIFPFSAFPPTGRFYNLVPGQSQVAAIRVVSNFREDFQLGEIHTEKGLVKIKSTAKTTDGYRITVEMTPPADTKKVIFRDQLTIEIKDHPQETLTVGCYGYLKPTKLP